WGWWGRGGGGVGVLWRGWGGGWVDQGPGPGPAALPGGPGHGLGRRRRLLGARSGGRAAQRVDRAGPATRPRGSQAGGDPHPGPVLRARDGHGRGTVRNLRPPDRAELLATPVQWRAGDGSRGEHAHEGGER